MAINSDTNGKSYWLAAAGGGVFPFGDAKFFGSITAPGTHVTGIIADANVGYRLITAQGNAIAFGTTPTS